jgi:hypothetical protein
MPSEYQQTQQAFRQKMGGALNPQKQAVHMLREKALFDPMKAAKGASSLTAKAADIAATTAGQVTKGALTAQAQMGLGGQGGIYGAAQDRARQQELVKAASQAAAGAAGQVSAEEAGRIAQQAGESEAAALKAAELAPTPAKDALKVAGQLAMGVAGDLAGAAAFKLGSKALGSAFKSYMNFKHGGSGGGVDEEDPG